MAKSSINTATTTQVYTGPAKRVIIQINDTAANVIKVIDGISGTTANVATITTATIGMKFEYYDFTAGVRIVTSGTQDITVSADATGGAK